LVPLCNAVFFLHVPIYTLQKEGEKGMSPSQLFHSKIFWLFLVMMLCAGASEQAVSQWASVFAESGLGVSKTIGDLAGPMAFATFMGAARLLYGKYGERISIDRFLLCSTIGCIACYLWIVLIPIPILSLVGCALCGFTVGIMWPGIFSTASKTLPSGGTAMFAWLAVCGDLGCMAGPTVAGVVSELSQNNLRIGICAAIVFPLLLLGALLLLQKKSRRKANIHTFK
jgi:fucose permease